MLFGAVWVWGDTRWILRLGPPLVVATARSWYSAPRRPVMAWVMSQGTTLPTEGKAASRHLHQDFDVNARLCIYRYGDAARTHARYIHIRTYIHIPLRIHSPHMTHTYAHMFLNLCWPSFWSPPHDKASSSHLLRPRARKNDDIFLEIIILHVHTRRHSSKFASYIYMDGFSCIDAYWWSMA